MGKLKIHKTAHHWTLINYIDKPTTKKPSITIATRWHDTLDAYGHTHTELSCCDARQDVWLGIPMMIGGGAGDEAAISNSNSLDF